MAPHASSKPALVSAVFTRVLLGILAAFALLALLRTPIPVSIAWAGFALLTAAFPYSGLLILAGLTPLGSALGVVTSSPSWTEPLIVAFLAGAAARGTLTKRSPTWRLPLPLVLLMLTVAASCVIQLALRRVRMGPAPFLDQITAIAAGGYFSMTTDIGTLTFGALFLEGLGLLAAVLIIVRHRPDRVGGVLRMMIAGAAGAAGLNLARLITTSIATGDFWTALPRIGATRINVQFGDVNAAGSYFAMTLCLALGVAISSARGRRLLGAGSATLIAIALWLTSSRAAFLSILVTGALWTVLALRLRHKGSTVIPQLLGGAAIAAGALLVVAFLPNRFIGGNAAAAAEIRRDMAVVSVRLLASEPVFGVGVGQFYDLSAPEMERLPVGHIYPRQNAHNNFLQILAELGGAGFLCFALVLWMVGRSLYSAMRQPGDLQPLAPMMSAALTTFLISALFGHPLLIPECAYAFWMLAGLASSAASPPAVTWRRYVGLAACAALVLSTPLRARAIVRDANLEHLGYGLSLWQPADDGERYRIAEGVATIFVPGAAAVARVPLRSGGDASSILTVSVKLHGVLVDRVQVRGASWTWYKFSVPETAARFIPLELQLEGPQGAQLHVGKVQVVQQRAQ